MDDSIIHCQNFIDGQFQPTSSNLLNVINPATESVVGSVEKSSASVVTDALTAATGAQVRWRLLPAIERATYLRRIAEGIRARADEIATVIVREQGKVMALAQVEVSFTADYMDYMAEWARRIEGEIVTSDRPSEHIFLFRQPVGVVAGILPWNFPFFLIARKVAPALVTGNTIVIKPSEETPLNAQIFAEIAQACRLPAGVLNIVGGTGAETGQALTSDKRVGMISFTGSLETGKRIMANAANNITKVNLELGGKAPAIVMDDADLSLAVNAIKSSRVINSGQVCNCAERVYVHRKVAEQFTEKMVDAMAAVTFGDPLMEQDVDMGPLVNRAALDKVHRMVQNASSAGAKVLTGGNLASRDKGFFYTPTVLYQCGADMEIMNKEIFGPVLPIQIVEDLDEAIGLANNSDYGLTSSIYTTDMATAMRACRDIHFGETYINRENFEAMQGYHAGVRQSGIGGADGKHGLYEFTTTHMVYIQY